MAPHVLPALEVFTLGEKCHQLFQFSPGHRLGCLALMAQPLPTKEVRERERLVSSPSMQGEAPS